MPQDRHELVVRERKLDVLRILELQDNIWEATVSTLNLAKPGEWPHRNDDDSYLAIAALVGTLAELAHRVQESDLGTLVVEVDEAWKQAIANMRH